MGRTIFPSAFARRLLARLCSVPFIGAAILAVVIAATSLRFPDGYGGEGGLNIAFTLFGVLTAIALVARAAQPDSKLVALFETLFFAVLISLTGAVASAGLARLGGDYVDPQLAAVDGWILPFLDWRAVAFALPENPFSYRLLGEIYVSLNWQPFALLLVIAIWGKVRDFDRFVGAWTLTMLACVLPFAFFAAQGPYTYFGISQSDLANSSVVLPWHYPPILAAIRNGSMTSLSDDCISGLVTFPSLHAASAMVLASAFWRFRWLAWPMLGLNVMMALAAVPIGGHYFIDVIVGSAIGLSAYRLATWISEARGIVLQNDASSHISVALT
ncbi:MAG: phosphatase PAP2 family protein [Erythrobacter sp.]